MGIEKLPIVGQADIDKAMRHGFHPIYKRFHDPDFEFRPQFENLGRDPALVERNLMGMFNSLAAGKRRWPLYLFGAQGCGKTCAGLAMCDMTFNSCFWDVDLVIDALFSRNPYDWKPIANHEFAVLDEIGGRDQVASAEVDAIKKFADTRERFCNRVAVYISNHAPEKIKELYGERIHSRLCCGTIYKVTGKDRRMG